MTKFILSLALLLGFVNYNYAGSKSFSTLTENVKVHKTELISLKLKDKVISSNPLEAIYTNYLGIKNSLTRDNPDSAAIYAKKLYKAIDNLKMDQLKPQQHKSWMLYMKKLSYDAEHIKGTTELEHQREHFMSLSANMYKLLKAFNTNSENIYYQFCPMANDGKGAYWVSEISKTVNPYFGKKMLNCGSTKETIKPAN